MHNSASGTKEGLKKPPSFRKGFNQIDGHIGNLKAQLRDDNMPDGLKLCIENLISYHKARRKDLEDKVQEMIKLTG